MEDARKISPAQLLERRKRAISLFEKGQTRVEIAETLNVHRNAVAAWINLWKESGMKGLEVRQSGAPKGSNQILNDKQQERIRLSLVELTPDELMLPFALWTREAVQALIKELFKITMPIRTVGHYLQNWGFTLQKPLKRASERDEKKVREWLEIDYLELVKSAKAEGAEIHWGEEVSLQGCDEVGRGYAPEEKGSGKAEKTNMISTVTNQGKVRFMFCDGRMSGERFIKFLERLIKDTNRKIYLILDILRIDDVKVLKEWLLGREEKIELRCLPSYIPDLNSD